MNRVYILSILFLLVACGKKHTISYKEYQEAHLQTREEHLSLIKKDTWLFDTLAQQTIDHMKEKDDKERVLASWEHASGYFSDMCLNQRVYSHAIVFNDHTRQSVNKMWIAYSDLQMVDDLNAPDVTFSIKFDPSYDTAIGIIQAMRTDVKKAMEMMLAGAEEYQKIVFGEEK